MRAKITTTKTANFNVFELHKSNRIQPGWSDKLIDEANLKQRFMLLWQRCLRKEASNEAAAIWQGLAECYSEPHRYYHDQNHLAHCLKQMDLAISEIADPNSVELAIWFHDVINHPKEKDNEQQSVEYFRRLAEGDIDPDIIRRVSDLIMATTHSGSPTDPDQQLICDIDLASFGCQWDCFMRDTSAVKAEFMGPDEEYYRGKQAFLESMLQRPRIFQTDFFNQRYERQARENVRRLLEQIDKEGGEHSTTRP